MEYAIDKKTGQEIKATTIWDDSEKRFICPVCKKKVNLSRGHKVSPHFKHKRGEGTTDCENYHPGTHHQEIALTISNSTAYSFPVRPTQNASFKKVNEADYSFDLNIQLSNPISTTLAWHLTITFTPHPNQNDYLLVKQGISGQPRVPLSQSVGIPVKIQESDYQLEIHNHLETKLISKLLQGLSSHIGNVFKHQGDHGSRLESSKPLYWGEQYFIIWHEKLGMNFPPEIKQRALTTQQNWQGIEIQLPDSLDNAIIVWAKRYLERTIEVPRFRLSLVTPFLDRSDTDITPRVKDTDEVVIAIIDSLGNHISDTLVVEHKTSKSKRINFSATSPVIIELGRLALGETTIRLENAQNGWLVINCVPQFEPIFPQAVRLKFKNCGEIPVHNSMKPESQGDSLTDIEFPTPMKFNILTKRQSGLEWQVTPITTHPEESLRDFKNRALQTILEQLNNQDLFVRLDFGNFGQLLIQQPAPVDKSDLALPQQVTRQLNWLTGLAQSGHPVSGEGLRMFKQLSRRYSELNHYFQHTQGIPATVEPHLRILARRIKKMWS